MSSQPFPAPPQRTTAVPEALARRDYTVLMALLMLSSSAVIVFNVAADALHAAIDPRVAR